MNHEEILELFTQTNVMQRGHFFLTSGRHGDTYMQCAHLFESPEHSEKLCRQLALAFAGERVDLVIGPAMGGIILAYEIARILNTRNIFAERENGVMTLRRGFVIPEGARVLVVEDVITTGGSVFEVMELVKSLGGIVAGVGVVVDRSNGAVRFGVHQEAVLTLDIKSYTPDECPLCAEGKIQLQKPGSRSLSRC